MIFECYLSLQLLRQSVSRDVHLSLADPFLQIISPSFDKHTTAK
jgi:hypothetical protein